MEYYHHQFQQVQPIIRQTGFNNNQFYHEHDPRFQPSQNMAQFPLHGRNWVDPYAQGTLLQSHRTETKPRLSKGEVAQLEAVFQENNKPSSPVKKGLAEQMRVDVARINNWFQNRRAKKKQELKAKEFEAKAEAEKGKEKSEHADASDTAEEESSTDQNEASIKSESRSPAAFDGDVSNTDQSQGSPSLAGSYLHDDQPSYTSPEGATAAYNYERHFGLAPTDDSAYYTSNSGNGFAEMMAASNAGIVSAAAVSAPMGCSMDGGAEGLEAFSYPALLFSGLPDGMSSFEAHMGGAKEEHFAGYQTDSVQPSIESNYQQVTSETMDKSSPLITQPFRLRSPPAVDLAGRRKRPGLALSGIRSTTNGPATGIDFNRRALDSGSPMRRVTSATGFGPQGIRRFPTQQRGAILDRRQESLLQAVRSPSMTSFKSMGPLTPDTPAVAAQQSTREATVSSNSSEDEGSLVSYQPTGLSSQHAALDQCIRTPPETPIGLGDVFATSIGASLGYPTTDESFLAPGMDTFTMRSNEFSIPSYITDAYLSQPSTPQLPMSSGYYASMPSSNREYSWTDSAMVSTKSSPNPIQRRQIQFSNVTPQDFNGGK